MKKLYALFIFVLSFSIVYGNYTPNNADYELVNSLTTKINNLIDTGKISKEKILLKLNNLVNSGKLSEKNNFIINSLVDKLSNNKNLTHGAAISLQDFTSSLDLNSIDKEILYSKLIPYLKNNVSVRVNDGARMVAYYVLGKQSFDGYAKLYIWGLVQEYYKIDNQLFKGGTVSRPITIYFKKVDNDYEIFFHESPREGIYFNDDLKLLYPQNVIDQIKSLSFIEALKESVNNQAIQYFK